MTSGYKTNQELIAEHQPLVFSLAKKIHSRLPPHIRLEDVVCYGQLGLAQAARSFRAETGSAFATFAYYRIRGAIYDGLTKMSWMNRSAYQRVKAEQMAAASLEATNAEHLAEGRDTEAESRWLAESTERLAVVYLLSGGGSPAATRVPFLS